MTTHISYRSLTQIGLQIPRWRTKRHRNIRTIQNSIEFKASACVLHDIRQVAAHIDLSRNKTRIKRQEILDIRQVAALNFATFWWWVVYVCILLYVCGLCLCICAWKGSCLRCMVVKVKEWVTSMEVFFLFLAIYYAYCISPYDSFYAGLSCYSPYRSERASFLAECPFPEDRSAGPADQNLSRTVV